MRVWLAVVPMMMVTAVPASAQIWGGPGGKSLAQPRPRDARLPRDLVMAEAPSTGAGEIRRIRSDIDRALANGEIDRRTARRLKQEANQIGTLADRYGRGGTSDSEAAELATRRNLLRNDVAAARSKPR